MIRGRQIDEEMVGADSLVQCLKQACACTAVEVQRVFDDPPDFWFTIDGERFAVEVTAVVTKQEYVVAYKEVAGRIASYLCGNGLLEGTFVLRVRNHPRLPKDYSRSWRRLEEGAAAFAESARDQANCAGPVLWRDSHGQAAISKASASGAAVGLLGPSYVKRESDVRQDLSELIGRGVARKRKCLEGMAWPDGCSKAILLLYAAYGAGIHTAREAMMQVDGYRWFHSIFWAASFTDRPNELSPGNPGRLGQFLYSSNIAWSNAIG